MQYGGCSSTLLGRASHGAVEAGVDPSGLGRYAWTRIRGRQLPPGEDGSEGNLPTATSKDLVLVSAYRPNPPGEGTNTVWIQHREFLVSRGRMEDPREAFVRDLLDDIIKWRTQGFEVIVGVDANDDLREFGPSSFRSRMKEVGMSEAILQRHGLNAPATYQRRLSSPVPIDGIFVSPGVAVKLCGYLGFQENFQSDHRCLWLDIDLKTTLGGFSPSPSLFQPRRLTLQDGRSVQRYLRYSEEGYVRFNLPACLLSLVQSYNAQGHDLLPAQLQIFDSIHRQMYEIRRVAEKRCRKLSMGGTPWSPELQDLRDRILLWKILQSALKGKRVSSRKIRRLLSKTGLPDAWKLDLPEIQTKLSEDRQLYRRLKDPSVARLNRSTFVSRHRNLARHRQHWSLQSLNKYERLQRMRLREESRRRRKAQGKGITGGLKAVQIEQADPNDPNGTPRLITLTDPSLVEEGCIQENTARYDQTRFPFPTPPMQEPLYSLFNGSDAQENVAALIQGSLEIPEVEPATASFLSQCRIPSYLPRLDLSISVEDHVAFWSKMKEDKGSEPHGLHNGHFKAGAKSDLLSQCDTIMREIPMKVGFAPQQWRHLMNFSIEKQPGEFRLSKMRTIQMMNSELQANNKKVGKEAMRYAESHKLIPPGQCGARKKHEAIALVISKRNIWDLLLQQRRAAGWISNDAKSCFDRIVHWVGMVALFRFGIPWSVLSMMFGTLQLAVHRVRTGFGDSDRVFRPPSEKPFQGCGQGNGAGPTIWVAVSAILICMLEAAGFGFEILSAVTGILVLANVLSFIDDADVIEAAKSVELSGEDIFCSVQRVMDLWSGGVRATGGALNPPKCFWWLIDFRWDAINGKWLFRRVRDFSWTGSAQAWQRGRPAKWIGSLLTQDLDGSLVPLRQLEPFQSEKTLWVMMSPLDDGKSQFSYLLEKSSNWAEKVRSSRLLRYDVLPLLRTTIMKTLEYPMAFTTFDQGQWFQLMSKPLLSCLPKAGICRFFPRLFVFAPLRYQGLGLRNPLVSQVFQHISFLMKHLTRPSQTSPFLKAVLEGHRLETGTGFDLFQQVYDNTAILTSDTWVKKVWKELDSLDIHLELDTWGFDLLRKGDALLMEIFMNASVPQEELLWLNWCRIYLQVVTLSDIVTADGYAISLDAWNGTRFSCRKSRFHWPRACRPSSRHWDSWRAWISKILLLPGSATRQLRQPLGPWLDNQEEWDWLYSETSGELFHRQGHIWSKCPVRSSSPRLVNREFSFPSPPGWLPSTLSSAKLFSTLWNASLPDDVKRASVFLNRNASRGPVILISGIGDSIPSASLPRPPSLQAAWKEMAQKISGLYGWVPDHIFIQGDERQLALDLLAGKLKLISDGSFKNHLGTAVAQLRSESSKNVIWIYCQTPGKSDDQSSYRSELIGLYAGILVITWLLKEWGPSPTPNNIRVQVGCDGRSALWYSFSSESINPSAPQFDLLPSIRVAILQSGLIWDPLHIKGHADSRKSWKDLTWWERRNVEVDRRASQYRSQLESSGRHIASNNRFFTEPCALFIRGEKMSKLSMSMLEDLIVLPQLRKAWAKHGRLSDDGFSQVDWDVVNRSMKSLPPGLQRWCTKHTVGVCGVSTVLHSRDPSTSPRCPMCEEQEDHLHVPRCQSEPASLEWSRQSEAFSQWLSDNGTAPDIASSLSACLQQVREPSVQWDVPWTPCNTVPHEELVRATISQSMIGAQGFLEGLLSSKWAPLQESYFRSQGSRRSLVKWAAEVSKRLICIGFHMWESRNHIKHSDKSLAAMSLSKSVNEAIRQQFALDPSGLPSTARRQLQRPLGKILSLPLNARRKWLKWILLERSLFEKSLRSRKTLMYNFTHSVRVRRRSLRSKRLFRRSKPCVKRYTQLPMGPWIRTE